jgi:hypothetical protein
MVNQDQITFYSYVAEINGVALPQRRYLMDSTIMKLDQQELKRTQELRLLKVILDGQS